MLQLETKWNYQDLSIAALWIGFPWFPLWIPSHVYTCRKNPGSLRLVLIFCCMISSLAQKSALGRGKKSTAKPGIYHETLHFPVCGFLRKGNSKHPWRPRPPRRPRPSSRHISLAWSLGSLKAVPARKNWWQRTTNLLKIWWNTVDLLYYLSKATSKYYVTIIM